MVGRGIALFPHLSMVFGDSTHNTVFLSLTVQLSTLVFFTEEAAQLQFCHLL